MRARRIVMVWALAVSPAVASAQVMTAPAPGPTELTLDRMVELGLRDSYRVRQLQLDVERTRSLLSAERARLKSRVSLNIIAPQFQAISDNKWNSVLSRNELIREDTRRVQVDLSVRQPVILFGYPTNGVLSLNNRVYRYTQVDGEERDTTFYNRYFIAYDQPLFQPNRMKNDLEEAELNLEKAELRYQGDVVGAIDDLAADYFDLVADTFRRDRANEFARDLTFAMEAVREVVANTPARAADLDLLQVELANAREAESQAASNLRNREQTVKQRLQLPAATGIAVRADLELLPITVDVERAVTLASTITPRMRQLAIATRENEIRLEETKGNGAFRMNLGLTYGREVQDPRFQNLWTDPRNSYTVEVDATVPIWDWGERGHRIQAQEYSLDRARLSEEQTLSELETEVRNLVASLEDFGRRTRTMLDTLRLAHQLTETTVGRYRAGEVGLSDLMQALSREATTGNNLLNAHQGYQRTLRRLKEVTFFDFEAGLPLVDRFNIVAGRAQQ
ncbi:MAG: TolC family protein [Vicinamibacterales bacterium]